MLRDGCSQREKGGWEGLGGAAIEAVGRKKVQYQRNPPHAVEAKSAIAARSNLGIAAGGFLSRQVVEQEKCNVHCAMSGGLSVVCNVEGGWVQCARHTVQCRGLSAIYLITSQPLPAKAPTVDGRGGEWNCRQHIVHIGESLLETCQKHTLW